MNESTLEGVFRPMPGKSATATQDNFTVGECSSGCFTFLANPSNGAPFLDGAFKLESCTDGGLMLNYDIYTEHQNSPNPDLSDTCAASGAVTSVFSD